MPIYVIYKKYC